MKYAYINVVMTAQYDVVKPKGRKKMSLYVCVLKTRILLEGLKEVRE